MAIVAITREMGTLGKDVATGLGRALNLPVIYHEVIDHLADRMRVRKSHVVRMLDGSAGLLERLTADKTSMAIFSADEIFDLVSKNGGAIVRGWGATHLLREVPNAVCVRVCAPKALRKQRMMERLDTDDDGAVSEEIRMNDEAHTAIMKRHFGLNWTEPEHYDLVLNTERVAVDDCVEEVLGLVRSPEFADSEEARKQLQNLALAARVKAALRRSSETRSGRLEVSCDDGEVTLIGDPGSTEEKLAAVEVAVTVPGVRDIHVSTRI
jgi:cytidylate kinase